jgi:hypothetical protein
MAQMNLPAYQVPRNALLDLSPINDAIDTGIRRRQMDTENQFRTEQMGMERERMGMARDREARAARNEDADTIGKAALAFSALPEGQRNPAAWDRALRRHPDYANLPAEYKDPNRGPNLVAAEYGKYKEPEKDDIRVVGNALLRVPRGGAPQVLYSAPDRRSEADGLEIEAKRLAVEKAKYERDNAYTTPDYRQRFKSAQGLGFTNEAAAQFAAGMIKVETDPVSKRRYYKDAFGRDIDEAALMQPQGHGAPAASMPQSVPVSDIEPVSAPGGAMPPPAPSQGAQRVSGQPQQGPAFAPAKPTDSLFLRADKITGTLQTLGAAASNVTENVPNAVTMGAAPGFRSVSKETQDAQREFDFFKREVQRVLALNPKIPVYEQQKLDSLIDRGMLTSPDKMRATLVTLHDNLERRIAQEMPLINDRDAPPDQRRDAYRFVREARAMMQVMGVPPKLGPEDARKLPPGTYFRSVDGNRILRVPGGR